MFVDRPPCTSYCMTEYGNGDIPKAVDQTGLDLLEIFYGEGTDPRVGYRPAGRFTVISPRLFGWIN